MAMKVKEKMKESNNLMTKLLKDPEVHAFNKRIYFIVSELVIFFKLMLKIFLLPGLIIALPLILNRQTILVLKFQLHRKVSE